MITKVCIFFKLTTHMIVKCLGKLRYFIIASIETEVYDTCVFKSAGKPGRNTHRKELSFGYTFDPSTKDNGL